MIKLSILIPTLPSRLGTFLPRLLSILEPQVGTKPVEILCFYDNKKRTVGAKRNALLSLAQGEYISFVDDDDRVADTYIEDILGEIYKIPLPDCVVFDCIHTLQGRDPFLCKYGKEFPYSHNEGLWTGLPAHTMCWKRTAITVPFPEADHGEDMYWVKRNVPNIVLQSRIDKVLYYYDFNPDTSETQSPECIRAS